MTKSFKIAMTGDDALDRQLRAIAAEDGPKSINKEMRRATRDAMKQIVLPKVKSGVPFETGQLESEITVKAIKRSRSKLGTAVGFKNDLFKGDTFYAGFLEFGFQHHRGVDVPGDSFLRRPLYQSEGRVKSFIRKRMVAWINARGR